MSAVVAYYLRHTVEVEAYLKGRERLARQNHDQAMAHPDAAGIRERLRAGAS